MKAPELIIPADDPHGPWRPGPDVPTPTPVPTRRWLCNAPCGWCGQHVEVALYWRVVDGGAAPFCDANCSLAWHEAHR